MNQVPKEKLATGTAQSLLPSAPASHVDGAEGGHILVQVCCMGLCMSPATRVYQLNSMTTLVHTIIYSGKLRILSAFLHIDHKAPD